MRVRLTYMANGEQVTEDVLAVSHQTDVYAAGVRIGTIEALCYENHSLFEDDFGLFYVNNDDIISLEYLEE